MDTQKRAKSRTKDEGESQPAPVADGSLLLQRTEVIEVPLTQSERPFTAETPAPGESTQVTVKTTTRLALEYIASSYPNLALQFSPPFGAVQGAGIHALPIYIDELEAIWGTDIYLKMLWDAQVKAADAALRGGILDKELQVIPAIEQEDELDDAEADAPQKPQNGDGGPRPPSQQATGATEKPQEARKPPDQYDSSGGTPPTPQNGSQIAAQPGQQPDSLGNKTEQRDGRNTQPATGQPAPQLTPAEKRKQEADQRRALLAKNVADFVRVNLEQLTGGFSVISWELLEGIAMGYKLAEQVYEIKEIIPGNGPQTCLCSINCKPQEAVTIVVDKYNRELGYLPEHGAWHDDGDNSGRHRAGRRRRAGKDTGPC